MCIKKTKYHIEPSEHNREERNVIMASMQSAHDSMMSVLDSFNGINKEEQHQINKEDLNLFPVLEWVELNDKIRIRRRKMLFGNYFNFDTELKSGGEFGEHFHQDLIESAEIISGSMLDVLDNEVYRAYDIMHYEKGEKHKPIALENTILKVIFKP